MSDKQHLREVMNEIFHALNKTARDLYPSIEEKYHLSERECQLVFGEALLRSAAINLACSCDADGDEMLDLVLALKRSHEVWHADFR